jgi:cell division protein FtsB
MPERIGHALRSLAAELVDEKRRVARLQRENRELRAQLEALKPGDDASTSASTRRSAGPPQCNQGGGGCL